MPRALSPSAETWDATEERTRSWEAANERTRCASSSSDESVEDAGFVVIGASSRDRDESPGGDDDAAAAAHESCAPTPMQAVRCSLGPLLNRFDSGAPTSLPATAPCGRRYGGRPGCRRRRA